MNGREVKRRQHADDDDETGVIILSLDNMLDCHVIFMQLHGTTQQLLTEKSSAAETAL